MIVCENVVKIFKTGEIEVIALQGLDFVVDDGEMMAIIGNSGSGKSTLLNILGGLEIPNAGYVQVDGKELSKLTAAQLVEYKRSTVGFVWQNPARNLIPYLTAQENVELPMLIGKKKVSALPPLPQIGSCHSRAERAAGLLELVGLEHRRKNRLGELSGGEQQRVAIAIALANHPKLLLADEPTGAVDSKTTLELLNLLRQLNEWLGLTVVIVTHDPLVSSYVDRSVMIRDGRTSSEFVRRHISLSDLEALEPGNGAVKPELEELTVVDRSGSVQLPREYLDALGVTGRKKMKTRLENGRIIMTPEDIREREEEK